MARPFGAAEPRPRSGRCMAIRVEDVYKSYGAVQAVNGVTFEVAQGEVFGLLGPNGAGKTTTVEMLEGLRKPDSGRLEVLGIDAARSPDALKQRVGVTLQTAELYPKLTVVEVLDLFRSFYARSLPTEQLIDFLDLGERRRPRPASCPVASASAWRSPSPWSTTPRSSSSTSRRPASTRPPGAPSGTSSSASSRRARRSS